MSRDEKILKMVDDILKNPSMKLFCEEVEKFMTDIFDC